MRTLSSILAAGFAALALSGCGLFHHEKKQAVKKKRAKQHTEAPATENTEGLNTTTPVTEGSSTRPAVEETKKLETNVDPIESGATTATTTTKPGGYPTARPVPDRPGFVISPYNSNKIDVSEMKSGDLAADPTYPASAKKYFRVP